MGIAAITDSFQKAIRLAPFLQVPRCLDLCRCGIAKTQQFSKLGVPDLVMVFQVSARAVTAKSHV